MDMLLQSMTSLRWQDILDILLNSFILFRLYVLFRGTNVIRVLVAIGILWILERVAVNLGLIVTSWAIQGIIAAAALIIIIVFRNEIASVFQSPSLRSFLWGIPKRQTETPIEIISESVYEIARHKLGALIVLPLKKGVEEYIHGGIVWQGRLSREMLLSIFWHGTPVHDGATVVQGDTIVEVSSILPLSKNSKLPSHFGTRHRAAAGLSEQTDALVIVVSEERGEVTVFKDRTIINITDDIELNQVLQKYAGTVSVENGAKKQLVELCFAAMLCFVGVTGVWLSFARGLETFATLEVPVVFMKRDPKMEIFSASASSVKLQLSGSGSLLRSVTPDQIKVRLNLENAVPGENQITITRDGINLPPGIELKQLEPQTLKVNLDVPTMKQLPVQPVWSGKLATGLILQKASVVPATVDVVGANLIVKDLRTIYTEKIPLENITTDGKVTVDLVLQPSSLKLAADSEERVDVLYTITKRPPGTSGKPEK